MDFAQNSASSSANEPAPAPPDDPLEPPSFLEDSGWLRYLRGHRLGIAPRLLAYILLFGSIVTLISTVLQLYFDYRRDVGTIENQFSQIEGTYLGTLAGSLWDVDAAQLKVQLDGMLRLPDMQALEVREVAAVSHPLVVTVGQRQPHAALTREFPITYVDGGHSKLIGTLYVEATLAGVYHRLWNTVLVILLSQGVKTFLASLFTLYIVFRLVTRHLIFIADYVDRFNLRDPPPLKLYRRPPSQPDELDRMVSAFNRMAAGLQSAYRQLREANSEMERDLTIRRSYEERLRRQAHYDDLTGLPNRVLMLDRLSQAIASARRDNCMSAVLFIDLDRFKDVNDTLGHAAGDELLRDAASRLRDCLREHDTLARMGGDEFVVILPTLEDVALIHRIASRVVSAFHKPFLIHDQEQYVTASIGITLFPTDGTDATDLLRNADLAMYKAKSVGRDGYHFFTQDINQQMQERHAIEGRLRNALTREELRLHYQPVIDLATNLPVGLEALVRWQQPDGSVVSPALFIPIAEEMGLIKSIGAWVNRTAFQEMCDLLKGSSSVRRIAVNVSPKQLLGVSFAKTVEQLLIDHALPPECLELEITEGVLLDDTPEVAVNLKLLCDLGVRLAIDDFGTGYSSLGYLQRYPFDTLKIDRSFVAEMIDKPSAGQLVETIITMAHSLGLEVVAEGVETVEQVEFLRDRGCDHVQGFLYSRPLPRRQLLEKVTHWGRSGGDAEG